MSDKIDRREFLHRISALGLSAAVFSCLSLSELGGFLGIDRAYAGGIPQVYMARGGTMEERLKRLLRPLGGISRFVKKGSWTILKPNAAWARKPDQAANTNPELIFSLTKACYKAGAKKVDIYEHSCDNYIFAFKESGIRAAVESVGGRIYLGNNRKLYR